MFYFIPKSGMKYSLSNKLKCTKNDNLLFSYISSGMSTPENDGTWTDGKSAEFTFKLNKEDKTWMNSGIIEGVFEIASIFNEEQRIIIEVNGEECHNKTVSSTGNIKFQFKNPDNEIIKIKLLLPDAISPQAAGMSNDTRRLAIKLRSIIFVSQRDSL